MAIGASFSPTRTYPVLGTVLFSQIEPTSYTLTTAGGVQTATAAATLSGLWLVDCQDAQSITTPTAALLVAAIPGISVGTSFYLDVINYGDTTLTIVVGTGVTKTTIATVSSVLTVATLTAKRFLFNCTGVLKQGSSADAFVIYTVGASSAAVS